MMRAHRLSEAEQFHHPVASAPADISAARHAFDRWLPGIGAGETIRSELAVSFSELVANAVHASEDAADHVSTRAWSEKATRRLSWPSKSPAIVALNRGAAAAHSSPRNCTVALR
jgi:anti-sigma regulatory factor (Ser/Thr protein kinase)